MPTVNRTQPIRAATTSGGGIGGSLRQQFLDDLTAAKREVSAAFASLPAATTAASQPSQQPQPQSQEGQQQHHPHGQQQQQPPQHQQQPTTTTPRVPKNERIDWFDDVQYALKSGRWENVRGNLRLCAAARDRLRRQQQQKGGGILGSVAVGLVGGGATGGPNRATTGGAGGGGFWSAAFQQVQQQVQQQVNQQQAKQQQQHDLYRSSNAGFHDDARQEDTSSTGLLGQDPAHRTPLHCVLASTLRSSGGDANRVVAVTAAPVDVIRDMVRLEPRAARVRNDRGRLPLHVAVLYRHGVEVVGALVDAYPHALSALDHRRQSPLHYAMEIAKNDTDLRRAPKSFWMTPYIKQSDKKKTTTTSTPSTAAPSDDRKDALNVPGGSSHGGTTLSSRQKNRFVRNDDDDDESLWMSTKPVNPSSTEPSADGDEVDRDTSIMIEKLDQGAEDDDEDDDEDIRNVDDGPLEQWQQEQSERWGIVHYLLLSFATYPQNLSVLVGGDFGHQYYSSHQYQHQQQQEPPNSAGSDINRDNGNAAHDDQQQQQQQKRREPVHPPQQPMLVDALLYAAPPAVIMLLIGASVMLLSVENRASAFAGSTLYSCVARHYPQPILESLVLQCPRDVRNVRDETGMGLVSAAYVSGCFDLDVETQEWTVNRRMLASLEKSVHQGVLYREDPAFVDWWNKIEYLILFCADDDGGGEGNDNPSPRTPTHGQKRKREYLLHLALCNADIPPRVIRLLRALYPESVTVPLPSKGNALPIHLAAQNQEYIPRKYEHLLLSYKPKIAPTLQSLCNHTSHNPPVDETTAAGILVHAHPQSIYLRHQANKRLPLHLAISAGKTFKALQVFLDSDGRASGRNGQGIGTEMECYTLLEQRDPVTKLYPFMQVAAYTMVSACDGYRWSCVARNQYSHTDWKRLTDRQKASAILRVAEAEGASRLSTIYKLLRRRPRVLIRTDYRANEKGERAYAFRDPYGKGMSSAHFLRFCYLKKKNGDCVVNSRNADIFASALRAARDFGLSRAPVFFRWWQKMKFWIRYVDPPKGNAMAKTIRRSLPPKDDEYLLHAALINPDTPPQIVELLLALFQESPKRAVNGTWLPLHVTCLTSSYVPRSFERVNRGSIELVLNAYPEAASSFADGCLPVHLAVRSGRTWEELCFLVEAEPRALKVRDPESKLYPFQMLCARREPTIEQRMQYQYVARNWYSDKEWEDLTPFQRVREIRNAQRDHQLAILSTAYEVLRKDVSVIANYNENYVEPVSPYSLNRTWLNDNLQVGDYDWGTELSQVDENDEDDCSMTFLSDDQEDGSSSSRETEAPSLMAFFSREQEKARQMVNLNVFDCDASVLSGVDVMSLVSNSLDPSRHQPPRRGRKPAKQALDDDEKTNLSDLFNGSQSLEHNLIPQGEKADSNADEDWSEEGANAFFRFGENDSSDDEDFVGLADLRP